MTPRAATAVALLLACSGCIAPPTAPSDGPIGAPPGPDLLWDGSALEGLECDGASLLGYVPSETMRPLLPDDARPTQGGVAPLSLIVWHCRSLLLDHDAPAPDAWLYVAYTDIVLEGTPGTTSYLLELGSDVPRLLHDPAGHDITTLHASFTGIGTVGTAVTLTGNDTEYRIDTVDPDPPWNPGERIVKRFLAGPDAATTLELHTHRTGSDGAPSTAVLDATGGTLGTLLDGPLPMAMQHHRSDLRIIPTDGRPTKET